MDFLTDCRQVEEVVSEKRPLSFYESKENRLEGCHIRKRREARGETAALREVRRVDEGMFVFRTANM